MEHGPVDQVHTEDPQRFLLLHVLIIPQTKVQDDPGRRGPRLGLKLNAEPAVSVGFARKAFRRHRLRKDEEPGARPPGLSQPLDEQLVLVVEHRLDSGLRDIAFTRAINGVAELHVVGRHRFGHGAGGTTDPEEPPGHFLTRADLGEGSVFAFVQIDLERLLICAEDGRFHAPPPCAKVCRNANRI